jgi:hypothetical protein
MAQSNPMDMVIGAGEAQRDAKAAAKHLEAPSREAAGDREGAVVELRACGDGGPDHGRRCLTWRTGWTAG